MSSGKNRPLPLLDSLQTGIPESNNAMEAAEEQDLDTLTSLEDRITRAVQAITQLRSENQQLQERLTSTQSELESTRVARDEAQNLSGEFQKENGELTAKLKQAQDDLNGLRGERKQVKARIEKLLGQLDLLSAT
jgi:chromosome segregation ATPase